MKKSVMSAISAGLVLTMACGYTVMANSNISVKEEDAVTETTAEDTTEAADGSAATLDIDADDIAAVADQITTTSTVDKQETVYVIAGASGDVQKVIVTEMLNNNDSAAELADMTGLTNIVNTKNDAGYTTDGDSIVWDAEGDKIYYRGDTDNELPVNVSISFKLDGEDISAEDLAGKSGALEMTFNYENVSTQTVTIDGKETEICVPFLMFSGMIVNNDNFKHITVDNGKVIDDGDRSIIVGFALPGLNADFDFDEDIFPESFTVKADVTDFSLATTLTLATNDVFNQFGFDGIEDTSDIDTMIANLTSNVQKMVEGAASLSTGLDTLQTKVADMVAAVSKLSTAATQLAEGAKTLDTGLNTIDGKMVELSNGLTTLSSNSATLNAGAKKVFASLLTTVQNQLTAAGLSQLGITVPTLTIDNYAATLTQISAVLKKYGQDTTAIDTAKASLDEYNTFYTGLAQYTAGVDSAATGSTQLEAAFKTQALAGSKQLSDGLATFSAGVTELNSNMPALTEGIKQLADGAKTLSDGLGKVYSEGVQKALAEIDNVSEFISRVQATLDVSAAYQSFGGISDEMTGSTKFIYRTDGIENN